MASHWPLLGAAIVKGLIAGLAGTLVMTVSQMIEMSITNRKPGSAPAVKKTLHIVPEPGNKKTFSNAVHDLYGTSWSCSWPPVIGGTCGLCGNHCTSRCSMGNRDTIEPKLYIAPPVTQWKLKILLWIFSIMPYMP